MWGFQLGPDPKPKIIVTSSFLSAPIKVGVTLYGWQGSKHITMFKKRDYIEFIWISSVSHLLCNKTVLLEGPLQDFQWVWLCSLYTTLHKCCSNPGVRKMWSEERKLIFAGGLPGSVRLIFGFAGLWVSGELSLPEQWATVGSTQSQDTYQVQASANIRIFPFVSWLERSLGNAFLRDY